jgi:hypothetical protein
LDDSFDLNDKMKIQYGSKGKKDRGFFSNLSNSIGLKICFGNYGRFATIKTMEVY